jgi:hypothetical protein
VVRVTFEAVVAALAPILDDPAYEAVTLQNQSPHVSEFRRAIDLLHLRCLSVDAPPTRDEITQRLHELVLLATGPLEVYRPELLRAQGHLAE